MAVCKDCERYNLCLVHCSESVLRNRGICEHFKNDWISVKDRLPGKKGDYIVNCHYRYNDGFVRNYVTVIHFRGKTQWATCNESISHWMPLPEPPKEE